MSVSIYLFQPPIYRERPETGNRLIDTRVYMNRGVTVLKHGSVFTEVMYPTQDDIAAADAVYQGGHDCYVTADEAAALQAAGYSVELYVPPVTSTTGSVNPANINGPEGPGVLTRTFG